jgi:Right handed beta helix region
MPSAPKFLIGPQFCDTFPSDPAEPHAQVIWRHKSRIHPENSTMLSLDQSILCSRTVHALPLVAATALCAFAHAAQLKVGSGMPYATIQAAINASVNGDEVLVEPGTYLESLDTKGKLITVRGRTGMQNTYVLPPSAGMSLIQCKTGETAATLIEGFTFANASGAPGVVISGSSPTFSACTVQSCQISNANGAGIQVAGTNPNPKFLGCVISGNRATGYSGGGAWLQSGLTTFNDCYFQSNEAVGNADLRGGGIYAQGGRVSAARTIFTTNAVRSEYYTCSYYTEGDPWARGAAVCVDNAASSFTDCAFTGNVARASRGSCNQNGYGTSRSRGGDVCEFTSASSFLRCTFINSSSDSESSGQNARNEALGGSLYFGNGADPIIDTCSFTGTRAVSSSGNSYSGAIHYENGCSGSIRNCTFTNAQSTIRGGAIYLDPGASPVIYDTQFTGCTSGEGGACWLSSPGTNDPSAFFLRVKFSTCSANIGGAVNIRDNVQATFDSCRFTGCTATTGQGGGIYTQYAPISIRNTAFDLNTSPTGSAIRSIGDTNRYPSLRGNFFCGNSGTSTNWVNGTWIDAPPYNTNQFAAQCSTDCNNNGIYDNSEIASGAVPDCNGNGVPDSCDIAAGAAADCNGNGIPDSCDIASGVARDCNHNGIPDSCDIASGVAADCNHNGIPDSCDIASNFAIDCDHNGVPDSCQSDCNHDGIPDACEIAAGAPDCNGNGIPDACDLAAGTLTDRNKDGVPDSCQKLEYLGLTSEYVPIAGTAGDPNIAKTATCVRIYANFSNAGADVVGVYGNSANPLTISVSGGGFFQATGGASTTNDLLCTPEIPSPSYKYDSWLTIGRTCMDANVLQVIGFNFGSFVTGNGFTDNDCIYFVTPGSAQAYAGPTKRLLLAQLTTRTGVFPTFRVNLVGRNADGSDWQAFSQLAPQPAIVDCNHNGINDVLDVATGRSVDCNDNGLPDECEFTNFGADCNHNGIPDSCDILAGTSQDTDHSGIPDECECIGDANHDGRVNVDDVVIVIIAWGDGASSPGDVNHDGIVNGLDLAAVLGHYGGCR